MEPIEFNAPFNKSIRIEEVEYEGGMPLLKVRIREGKRFTLLELDPFTAERWAGIMLDWAGRQPRE